jgi:superfamily II DNA/RNA helicase
LAAQVAENFDMYGKYNKLNMALLIGGVSFEDQERALERGVDVLIATPGRLLDHFERGKVLLNDVKVLVIDEADRMLDMGFIPDVERIVGLLPPLRQTLFFSATMPPEIKRLADRFLSNPREVTVTPPASTAKNIVQGLAVVAEEDKREALRRLIREQDVKNAIVFCNRKRDVAVLQGSLKKHGFNAGALHGDMDQSSRTATLDGFREGRISLLAASDVAARGLDIPDVSHIFNFDVPWQADDYVHRIGRTGRAGKEGRSLTLVTPEDGKQLKDIEKMLGEPITWIGEAPNADDLASGKRRRGRGGRGAPAERSGSREGRGGGRFVARNGAARRPDRPSEPRQQNGEAPLAGVVEPPRERTPERPAEQPRAARQETSEHPRERPQRSQEPRERNGERQPRPQRARSQQAAQPRVQDEPRSNAPHQRSQRPERKRHVERDNDRTPAPVGLGDHVPAFLKKTTRLA